MTQEQPCPEQLTVRDLRRRWKPTKDRLGRAAGQGEVHPLCIRIHRAFSWLAAIEGEATAKDYDQQLIYRWIALNALYGRWNNKVDEPARDAELLRIFTTTILKLDQDGRLAATLHEKKPLVLAIMEDKFLNEHFWKLWREDRDICADRTKFRACSWYSDSNWTQILDELLSRIYLVRCQLVHGAATCDGQVNRQTVRRVAEMLGILLVPTLMTIIDHGLTTDWGELCYPPVKTGRGAKTSNSR